MPRGQSWGVSAAGRLIAAVHHTCEPGVRCGERAGLDIRARIEPRFLLTNVEKRHSTIGAGEADSARFFRGASTPFFKAAHEGWSPGWEIRAIRDLREITFDGVGFTGENPGENAPLPYAGSSGWLRERQMIYTGPRGECTPNRERAGALEKLTPVQPDPSPAAI